MISHIFQNQEEFILDDINEETSIDNLDCIIKEKIKALLKTNINFYNNNYFKIQLIPGSISSNYKEGYYERIFSISFSNSLNYCAFGYFSAYVRLIGKNKIELIEMNVGINQNELTNKVNSISKINFNSPFSFIFKFFGK